MTERETRMFLAVHQAGLTGWVDAEVARLQALLMQQTETVAIFRTQGELQALARLGKLMQAARDK